MAGVFAGVGSVFVCVHTLCMVGPYCVHFEVLVMCDFHTDFFKVTLCLCKYFLLCLGIS